MCFVIWSHRKQRKGLLARQWFWLVVNKIKGIREEWLCLYWLVPGEINLVVLETLSAKCVTRLSTKHWCMHLTTSLHHTKHETGFYTEFVFYLVKTTMSEELVFSKVDQSEVKEVIELINQSYRQGTTIHKIHNFDTFSY